MGTMVILNSSQQQPGLQTHRVMGQRPTTRRLLTAWIVVLLGCVLAGLTSGIYFHVERDLERRTLFQLRHQVLDCWNPQMASRREKPPTPHPGGLFRFQPSVSELRKSLQLVLPDNAQPPWQQMATPFIHLRYYDTDLRKQVELGGPPDKPKECPQELQQMLLSHQESREYSSDNLFEGWLMWSQLVRDRSGKVVGILEMGMGSKPSEDLLHNLAGWLAFTGSVALLVGIVMAAMIARIVCRPLEKLAAKMESLSSGDFSVRAAQQGPSEVQTMAASFNRMVSQLSQVFESQRRFVADASHELKTPLTSVQTMVEALRDHHEMPAERKQRAFFVIERELHRVNQLIHDLLTLSRLDEPTRAREQVDLKSMVTGLGGEYSSFHSHLQVECGEAPACLELVDPAGGERALRNLLDNALAHTVAPARVTLRLHQKSDGMVIEVADEGAGIPPEDLPHVTRRFYRSDQSRSRLSGGSGLGLAIVSAWVSLNGGRLELESVVGKGTVVSLWLPINA